MAAYFHSDTISIPVAARARKDRFAAAKTRNPKFTTSILSSMGETALYLRAMQGQDRETRTEYVQILFRQSRFLTDGLSVFVRLTKIAGEERIPFNEGYKRSNVTITPGDLGDMVTKIAAAS